MAARGGASLRGGVRWRGSIPLSKVIINKQPTFAEASVGAVVRRGIEYNY